ncbi:hypothetical protein [Bdellovibrio sp. HCB-110]|uniref:hypothetical protein n=1 Tax=Bdellovibrio sp. HCB-110 TaxID=3391182 RepID=UPI0039B461DC
MKNAIVIAVLSVLGSSALAQIQELQGLIPAGKSYLQLAGHTKDNKKCTVNLFLASYSYSAALAVLDENGNVDSRRFGTFQLGMGHEIQKIEQQGDSITAISLHEAEESYGSDSRSTLRVNKSGDNINAVQIVVEEKGLFGFKTKTNETCAINKN